MKLCIAEKPSVARQIAAVIGATHTREGYMEGAGYCVTWTYGHLCELKEPKDYTSAWRKWTLVHLPMIPPRFGIKLKDDDGIRAQFEVIRSLMQRADVVINCGDAGQEGELIQRWVMQLANNPAPVKRLWLSSMTNEAIKEAFDNLAPAEKYDSLYYAGMTRAVGDWLLGINATRLYTVKYHPGQYGKILSIGRVQTPTLALIVDRYEEIQNFRPQPYWEIKTLYRGVTFTSTKGRYKDVKEANAVIEKIRDAELKVTKIDKKKGKEGPPRLFDLTSLQVEVNKKFGYSADDTLKTLQNLYERKLVTYPRVDTTYLPDDLYSKIPDIMNKLYARVPDLITPLAHKKIRKSKKVFDNSKITDHHAIIPTGELPHSLSVSEGLIYDLIISRFIAAFYPDMEYEQTTVMADILGHKFKATGRVILKDGWKFVYQNDAKDDKDEASETANGKTLLPPFILHEHGPHTPELLEKQTQPPKLYTEGTLLNAMETAGKLVDDEDLREVMKQKGIGRPSTRASIIQTLLQRGYVVKQRKNLVPTDLGITLIHTIQNDLLKSVQLTGEWEYKLRQIERNEYSPVAFLNELKEMVQDLVEDVLRSKTTLPKQSSRI